MSGFSRPQRIEVLESKMGEMKNELSHTRAQSVLKIWGGGDTTIPSPGVAPKQLLPGIGLHDPLHGRQACPEFNSFHQGVGQISPPEDPFCAVPSQNGDKLITSPPPAQLLNDSTDRADGGHDAAAAPGQVSRRKPTAR